MPRSASRKTPKPPQENLALGTCIRDIRKKRNISQAELGDKLGLSQRTISAYESGHVRIPSPILIRIADALHASIPELTGNKRRSDAPRDREIQKLVGQVELLPPRKRKQIAQYVEFVAKAGGA